MLNRFCDRRLKLSRIDTGLSTTSLRGCFQMHKFVLFAAGISREGLRVEEVMYPSNLTDAQWGVLEPALNSARTSRRGRPVVQGMRRMLDAIL